MNPARRLDFMKFAKAERYPLELEVLLLKASSSPEKTKEYLIIYRYIYT